MKSFRSKPVGWRGESYRHSLAARGYSASKRSQFSGDVWSKDGANKSVRKLNKLVNERERLIQERVDEGVPLALAAKHVDDMTDAFRNSTLNYVIERRKNKAMAFDEDRPWKVKVRVAKRKKDIDPVKMAELRENAEFYADLFKGEGSDYVSEDGEFDVKKGLEFVRNKRLELSNLEQTDVVKKQLELLDREESDLENIGRWDELFDERNKHKEDD